jgi:hypothetical protein
MPRTIEFEPDEIVHWQIVHVPAEAIVCDDGSVFQPEIGHARWVVTCKHGEFMFPAHLTSGLQSAECVATGERVLVRVPVVSLAK